VPRRRDVRRHVHERRLPHDVRRRLHLLGVVHGRQLHAAVRRGGDVQVRQQLHVHGARLPALIGA